MGRDKSQFERNKNPCCFFQPLQYSSVVCGIRVNWCNQTLIKVVWASVKSTNSVRRARKAITLENICIGVCTTVEPFERGAGAGAGGEFS